MAPVRLVCRHPPPRSMVSGIIVEHGFIDNHSDVANLDRRAEAMVGPTARGHRLLWLGYRWVRSEDGQHFLRMLKGGAGCVYNAWKHVGNKLGTDDNGYVSDLAGSPLAERSTGLTTRAPWSPDGFYIDGSWYYFADSGAMQTGWQKLGWALVIT